MEIQETLGMDFKSLEFGLLIIIKFIQSLSIL